MPEKPSPQEAAPLDESQRKQRLLYDRITDETHACWTDKYSRLYVNRFMSRFLFRGVPLAGKNVLDAACGSGGLTEYLIAAGATVTGLDISERTIASYAGRFPGSHAVCRSIFATGFPDEVFDCVCMGGALHHFHPEVQKAIDEVCRVLKPNGMFCFCEPHAGSLPDALRKLWYRHDRRYFEENEASVNPRQLLEANRGRFRLVSQRFGGNVAYLLVSLSVFLRIPSRLKPYYAAVAASP